MIKTIILNNQPEGKNVSVYVVHTKHRVIDGVWMRREDADRHVAAINKLNPQRQAMYTRTTLDSNLLLIAIKAQESLQAEDNISQLPCVNCERTGSRYCHINCEQYRENIRVYQND